ncbi:MAG: two pore domain potassium channel family protein [Alphaproteobacteria bacterium]|nr:two pore domain potassium channel family protein [Alphaproteobacteria bacterium]
MPKTKQPHWLGGLIFTIFLLVLISASISDKFYPALLFALIASVGAIYLLFPRSMFFNGAFANFLGVYACTFVFFSETNFSSVSGWVQRVGFVMPIAALLGGVVWRRREIQAIVTAPHLREVRHIGRIFVWLVPVFSVGAGTFFLPVGLTETQLEIVFLSAMGLIAVVVLFVSRMVSIFLLDSAILFEAFFRRMSRLALPAFAFLTFYSLIVIIFACIYRIIDRYTEATQFLVEGRAQELGFLDALYFSVVTLSTLGYGDISPDTRLVQVIVGVQIISGLLLLLFGFNEIARSTLLRGPTQEPFDSDDDQDDADGR